MLVLNRKEAVSTIGSRGSGPGQFSQPVAVAVNLRGEIAVADGKLNRIQVFSGSGDLEHCFGRPGAAKSEFKGISDLKFTSRGYLAVVDAGNHRVQVITVTGVIVQVIGRYGWKRGQFINPCGLVINGKGDFFVCDEGNKRIQRISERGKPILEWSSRRGSIPNLLSTETTEEMDFTDLQPVIYSVFDSPCAISIGIHGEIIVCDVGRRQVLIFSDVGACLHIVDAPGIFQSNVPTAVTICSNMLVTMTTPTVDGSNLLVAFPPPKRVRAGRFEAIPTHCSAEIVCYLIYNDALHLRLACRFFHRVCLRLRNQWRLFPLQPGQATVKKYNQVVSPASGLVAVEETFQKWGLQVYEPNHRVRKHVMDFKGGFCSALSALYGPLFCYQHEDLLLSFFRYYTLQEKEEIQKAAFIEIVTQIEEVRANFRTWEQCTPFSPSSTNAVALPTIKTTDNLPKPSGNVPLPKSLQLIENAQQHQVSKLLTKFITL
ncbi:Protein wech [Phytophthora citrophthora]|uniref:Protein wech n=1 Tax=Phytophthora citrophthora TaxID=4793 RepID=A0AAD9GXN3_9STRA|nr:Protein wech [Phytophthora citrophthora]